MTDEIPSLVKPMGFEPIKKELIMVEDGHLVMPYDWPISENLIFNIIYNNLMFL